MTIARKARIFWPVVLLVFLADCSTKDLAETHLVPWVSEPVVGDVFRFTLAYNPEAAMSISFGEQTRLIISLIALIEIGILGYLYRRSTNRDTVKVLAIALVIAGAVGNLADRIRSPRGVVDFIDVGIGSLRFWTFNIADIGVTVGAVLLAWQLSQSEEPRIG
jgi:signal peptidase II